MEKFRNCLCKLLVKTLGTLFTCLGKKHHQKCKIEVKTHNIWITQDSTYKNTFLTGKEKNIDKHYLSKRRCRQDVVKRLYDKNEISMKP